MRTPLGLITLFFASPATAQVNESTIFITASPANHPCASNGRNMISKAWKYALLCFGISCGYYCNAQQQPMYTQYMFNGLLINPAYAGTQETFTATAMTRKQWAGIDGAPVTQTFSAHSPLDNLRTRRRPGSAISLGLTLFHDRIAITSETGLLASYAYRIKFPDHSYLSLGIQGGVSQFRMRYSELGLDDPQFSGGDVSEWQPDFGAGLYYRGERFYAGLSAPQLIRHRIQPGQKAFPLSPHYFFTAGYVFDINRDVKLKPSVLLKSFSGIVQMDLNCNVFLNERVSAGLSWRSSEAVATMVQLQAHPRFGFGYSFDIPYSSGVSRLSNGSHELMVNYKVPRKRIRTINPRYF